MISFHKLLIATAILFCALMTGWGFVRWCLEAGAGWLALSVVFGVLTLLLAYYLRNLKRFLGKGVFGP